MPRKNIVLVPTDTKGIGSEFGRLIVAKLDGLFARSAGFRHHRIAIFIAIAIEEFLPRAKGRNALADVVAQVGLTERGEARG